MHKSSVPKSKVKVLWLCSRSQPGIKVIIRDLRGHLLHTVTFLVQEGQLSVTGKSMFTKYWSKPAQEKCG